MASRNLGNGNSMTLANSLPNKGAESCSLSGPAGCEDLASLTSTTMLPRNQIIETLKFWDAEQCPKGVCGPVVEEH